MWYRSDTIATSRDMGPLRGSRSDPKLKRKPEWKHPPQSYRRLPGFIRTEQLGGGGRSPPQLSALQSKWLVVLRADFVLTMDTRLLYYKTCPCLIYLVVVERPPPSEATRRIQKSDSRNGKGNSRTTLGMASRHLINLKTTSEQV